MDKVRLLICDIDGTVADNSHRQGWLRMKPKNWPEYEKNMADDPPIQWVIDIVKKFS